MWCISRFFDSFSFSRVLASTFVAILFVQSIFVHGGVLSAQASSWQTDDSVSFVGIKKSKTAKILDDFKEGQKEILIEKSPFTPDEEKGLFESEGQIRNLEQMLTRVQTAKDSLKEQKLEITSKKFTLQSILADLDEWIASSTQKMKDAEEAIRIKNKEIADALREIVLLQARIDANKEAILGYLSYLYSKGDQVYGEDDSVDIIRTLVFTDGSISDVLANYHFLTILEITGQNFLEERRELLGSYYVQTQALKEEKQSVIRIKQSLAQYTASLEEQKRFKQELLEQTKGQEALFNEYISDRQEKQNQIEARLAQATQLYDGAFSTIAERSGCVVTAGSVVSKEGKSSPKCADLNLSYQSEKKLRSVALDEVPQNPMDWPVEATRISAYYQDADYFDSVWSSHEGIDIPVDQWSDVKAPMAGYVYFINEPTQNGYGYMAIKHPNGFMTVYGHISEVLVKKFDFIEKGQVFAKSGGAPGTPWAGVMSSGPHLHFEVWLNQQTVDGLRYLDVSRLRYESLSTKYKYKFIEDLKLRYGYMANTTKYDRFRVSWDTEIERQKDLLDRYATPDFAQWNVWTEEALEAKLDPSFLICIGLAETGLGRNLKTPYNVGNIGNTDSGGTQDFLSPRDGVYWMAKTLNNKFLGDYTRVSELSRWGNKTGSIYASSPKNWHENIIRCLSALKGRFVEDDYAFRLSPADSTITKAQEETRKSEGIRTPNAPSTP